MAELHEKQRYRHNHELRLRCIAELNKSGMVKMPDGRSFEECSLFTLQYALLANGAGPRP